jgi:hypothetical protein
MTTGNWNPYNKQRRLYPRAAPAWWPELEPDTDFSKKTLAVDNMRPSLGAATGTGSPRLGRSATAEGLEGVANPTDLLLEFAAQTPRLVYAEPPQKMCPNF